MNNSEPNFNVIDALNKAGLKLADSQLKPEVLKGLKPVIKKLSGYLGLSETQTILFTATYMASFDGFSLDLRNVFEYLGMKSYSAPLYIREIRYMLDNSIIESDLIESRRSMSGGYNYSNIRINPQILKSIFDNKTIDLNAAKVKKDMYSFCAEVSDMIEIRNNRNYPAGMLYVWVDNLECQNPHLQPVVQLMASELGIEDRTMLYEMYDDVKCGRKATGLQETCEHIYDDVSVRMKAIRKIMDKESPLCTGDYIVNTGGTYANEVKINLSERSIDIMFGEDATQIKNRHKSRDIKTHADIPAKQLFFEPKLDERIQFFSNALQPANHAAMQQRMAEKGLVKGLTAIFYGLPGTGKTETAYQLARQTGRDIYMVDVSKTKSMWLGESEKAIRQLFDSYRVQCKRLAQMPVLLFNEKDAILSTRQNNNKSLVSETENALKNILLEELESFEGILIATTNLVGNMDKAFERRFMFKIEYTKPTAEARAQIWQSKLEWLTADYIDTLVARYEFSGGEIDNIVRKATLNEVLTGNRPNFDELIDYCETEKYSGKKVGYN